jgi:hypothetical protein
MCLMRWRACVGLPLSHGAKMVRLEMSRAKAVDSNFKNVRGKT